MTYPSDPTATVASLLVPNRSRDAQRRTMHRTLSGYTAAVVARLREIAPYAAIELVLPGGSLMALLVWLYRRQRTLPTDIY